MDCKISPAFQMGYLYTFCAEKGTCKCYCCFNSAISSSLDVLKSLGWGFTCAQPTALSRGDNFSLAHFSLEPQDIRTDLLLHHYCQYDDLSKHSATLLD
jgi:hypothetical protein